MIRVATNSLSLWGGASTHYDLLLMDYTLPSRDL